MYFYDTRLMKTTNLEASVTDCDWLPLALVYFSFLDMESVALAAIHGMSISNNTSCSSCFQIVKANGSQTSSLSVNSLKDALLHPLTCPRDLQKAKFQRSQCHNIYLDVSTGICWQVHRWLGPCAHSNENALRLWEQAALPSESALIKRSEVWKFTSPCFTGHTVYMPHALLKTTIMLGQSALRRWQAIAQDRSFPWLITMDRVKSHPWEQWHQGSLACFPSRSFSMSHYAVNV